MTSDFSGLSFNLNVEQKFINAIVRVRLSESMQDRINR